MTFKHNQIIITKNKCLKMKSFFRIILLLIVLLIIKIKKYKMCYVYKYTFIICIEINTAIVLCEIQNLFFNNIN